MELSGKRFCMISDKEQLLQTLNMNNVPSVEVVDPKTCTYPIVGRRYGHDSGKNLAIIHTMNQALDEGHDFYTKLYAIEKEYYLEIDGLTVKNVQIAAGEHVVFHEIPIRTESFGWRWKAATVNDIDEEWINIAIRALYVTGLANGYVKIGKLPNETFIVVDINPAANVFCAESSNKPMSNFTIGADIEFMLSCDGELLPASTFFPIDGEVGCDARQIEQDSNEFALAEIRPEEAENSQKLFENIQSLIMKASEMVPYKNIEFRAGSMPFQGYQVGGHIHFGTPLSLSLLRALDHYLAIPVAMVEESSTARRRRKTKHGGLGRYREKTYGFEYLTLSSWIIDPKLTMSIICLARLVTAHHDELQSDILFNPLIQRAYYNGNIILLKQLWTDLKNDIMKTSSYLENKNELAFLFEAIEKGYPYYESEDIRINWGMTPSDQKYDQGLVIQIPRKTRVKYNLNNGHKAYVSAGKRLTQATIRAFPFTFSYGPAVQLSNELSRKLALPKGWNPKVTYENGVINLGPVIGIIASRPFDRQTTYFQHLCRLAAEKQMLVYIFEPKDIIWEQQLIKGTTFDGEGFFPFPAVIYDRYFFEGEKINEIDEVRVKLQTVFNIPFVNPMSLFKLTGNKWDCHLLLSKKYEEYLPETRLLQHSTDVIEMLDHYGEIYLKPIGGAMSIGVIRIIRRPIGVIWMEMKHNTVQQLMNLDELFALTNPLMNNNHYIIQEGIRRQQFKGENLEVRVYMQKNGKQKWFRTGMVARLTAGDVLTANTEKNMRVSKVLQQLYPDVSERHTILKEVAEISRSIVATVENEIGAFGELAVDLCIDQYNSIKIVEINSKPDNLFSQIRAFSLRNIAGIRLLNYAASLAGYEEEMNNELGGG
ncbi:hypothetical protein F7731_03615 [Cytobacillus depressus]|uniref:ATP-grasp domain-containing protein n=1 Tax=Cytobacillus depressus TaxID=1602942 RepID=A0A6L3VAL3_9BACI|nr:YheC/YheD family protein [Cytobacillus depressus]KAB2338650.1 hypothetical protein F7731_03615 [Cytobacillus depressus]